MHHVAIERATLKIYEITVITEMTAQLVDTSNKPLLVDITDKDFFFLINATDSELQCMLQELKKTA